MCSQLCKRLQSWLRNLPEKAMTQSAKRGIILRNFCRAFIIRHESFWTRQIVVDINKHKHADILKKENESKTSHSHDADAYESETDTEYANFQHADWPVLGASEIGLTEQPPPRMPA